MKLHMALGQTGNTVATYDVYGLQVRTIGYERQFPKMDIIILKGDVPIYITSGIMPRIEEVIRNWEEETGHHPDLDWEPVSNPPGKVPYMLR